MRALFGRTPDPEDVEITHVPAEPPATVRVPPRTIDRGEVVAMFDAFIFAAQKAGANALADMILDQRDVVKPVRPMTVVPGRAS